MIELRGISWDHPRGHDCMVASAAAYTRECPGVHIVWETRSLQAFADAPVEQLAERYDLIVIDHPHVGFTAASGCLLPLDEYLEVAVLDDLARHSVGPSHRSYAYHGHLWALANDAAAQVAAYRPDLIARLGGLPRTWDDVLRLAHARRGQETARVAIPLIPVDTIMCFCSICAALGEAPFAAPDRVVARAVGRQTLEILRCLRQDAHPVSLATNPPRLLDRMSTTDEVAYSPLLFGYSNYARPGFRTKLVRFSGVPTTDGGGPRGGILGGAGLAVSAHTRHPAAAAEYARYVVNPDVQCTVYFASGGQPAHRAAWLDDEVNAAASDFFRDTLPSLDNAYLRPRYPGFISIQERCGEIIHRFLRDDGDLNATLDALDATYRGTRHDD